ncbi:MAG TPA: hypothetical protein VFE58_02910 [Tepidisphaeraceae bacterium]|nr:hypothetical protein [Tepidisphaeraceae bacterium]
MKRWVMEWWWAGVCIGLLGIYAVMAWSAVSGKSATYDEPLEVVSGWAAGSLGDYRVDYEHPPLWKKWAWIGNWGKKVNVDLGSKYWTGIGEDSRNKWYLTHEVMYGGANEPHGLVRGMRGMMLLVAVMCGAAIGWWAWRLGGKVAAIVAVGLFAFDPGFLGHGPLVKNDVAMALLTVAVMALTWSLGKRFTWSKVAGLGVLCGMALVVKLSALVLGPIVGGVLIGKAVLGKDWRAVRRFSLALGVIFCLAMGMVWATYGFRYAASPRGTPRIDMNEIVRAMAQRTYRAEQGRVPTEAEIAAWDPGMLGKAVMKLNEWKALPEAWLAGVLFTERTAVGEDAYLNGKKYYGGKWYYYLEAIAVKTPMGVLMGVLLAVGWSLRRRQKDGWAMVCLGVPAAVLLGSAMGANLNLGVRYVLPVYALGFVWLGVAASNVWGSRAGKIAVTALGILVIGEVVSAYPNFIAFFNGASGGNRGGLALLGDSNLDWGQDLPAVAEWQKRHPDADLFLGYFGTEDPASWGIRYHNLPGGYMFGPEVTWPTNNAYILVGATNLQGIYFKQDLYESFRRRAPEEVLEGTIYVYQLVK